MPDPPAAPVDPPFYRYAAKFLIALGAAIVGAAATILAAFDDDHVSGKEVAAIVLAVLAGVYGPAAVYAVRNATRVGAERLTAVSRLALPAGGYLIVKEALTADQVDKLTKALEQGHGQLFRATTQPVDGSAAAARTYPGPTGSGSWTSPGAS